MLVGSGSGSDMLDEEIRRKCANIRWIREYVLDRADIRHYLSAADVYVFPSRREGFRSRPWRRWLADSPPSRPRPLV
jgi:starch synthase